MTRGVMVKSNCTKMRRILGSLIALGLAGFGSVPVSACALVHSRTSECASPQTKTECGHMGMGQAEKPPVSVSHLSRGCCAISEAPQPQAQTWAGSFAVAAPPALTSEVVGASPPLASTWFPDISCDSSPPPRQSLLCTFLI